MQGTMEMLNQIGMHFSWNLLPEVLLGYWKVYTVMTIALIIHWIPEKGKQAYRNWYIERPLYQQLILCVFVVFLIYQFVSADKQPFIYFQF